MSEYTFPWFRRDDHGGPGTKMRRELALTAVVVAAAVIAGIGLFTILRAEPLKLSEQRGKPVMINFWATWCAPCREEMPAMERLYRRHRERGFVLLAVSVDTDASLVRPFPDQHKLTFPVTLDAKMDLANTYGVRALPSS